MSDEPTLDELESSRMPLLDHLVELRDRMMWATGSVLVSVLVCLLFVDHLFTFLSAPVVEALAEHGSGTLAIQSPLEGVYTYLAVAGACGLVLSSPMVALQAWGFVAPGLYASERKVVLPLAAASSLLFITGAAFAYWIIFPVAFPFFLSVTSEEVQPVLSISTYLGVVVRMIVAFGACFQMPVISWFVARIGLIDHLDLYRGFRYAVVAIFLIAAIITPPDVITQVLLAIPLVFLYLVSMVVAFFASTKDRSLELSADS